MTLSHLAVWSPSHLTGASTLTGTLTTDDLKTAQSTTGYDGEQAHVRVARLCVEETIPFTAGSGPSMTMGPQPVRATALEIFRDCETADIGSLYEVGFGLGYQSHTERDNAAVKLTLDMDQGHVSQPPEPTDDDQGLTNKFTASRTGGSEATYEKTTGALGTGTGGPGLYDDSATPNVQTDAQLFAYASARVVRGTIDEDRWPRVEMKFTASPELIPTWTGMEPFGARINIVHPPTQMAPDTIDAFIDGYSMAFTPVDWDVAINTTPGSPHHVFVLAAADDDTNPLLGYMVPTTCVLAEDLDTTETGVDITTTPLWSTTAADWTPGALITVDGEDMTVTAVSGGSNPQTLTVTRSVNGVIKTHTSGATVAFKFPGNLGL
jgi:hypothetical protein